LSVKGEGNVFKAVVKMTDFFFYRFNWLFVEYYSFEEVSYILHFSCPHSSPRHFLNAKPDNSSIKGVTDIGADATSKKPASFLVHFLATDRYLVGVGEFTTPRNKLEPMLRKFFCQDFGVQKHLLGIGPGKFLHFQHGYIKRNRVVGMLVRHKA